MHETIVSATLVLTTQDIIAFFPWYMINNNVTMRTMIQYNDCQGLLFTVFNK